MNQKPYEELTHRGQIGRLKSLASEVLEQYSITPTTISPLVHLFNTTFKIDTDDGRYVLRINRPNFHSQAGIRSEMIWLSAIRRDTDLIVPDPLTNHEGDFVTRAEVAGVPEARDCVVFRWVDGEFYRKKLSPSALGKVGAFMALLHNHVQAFDFPESFDRIKLQLDGQVGEVMAYGLENGRHHLTQEDRDDMARVVEIIKPEIDALGTDKEIYNLIHGDLHQGNYLFKGGAVRAIDFDDCGWGHFAYDIAISFWYLGPHPALPEIRKAFLKGYRTVRDFPAEHEPMIDSFMALRSLMLMSFIAGDPNPRIQQIAPQYIASIRSRVKRFLEMKTNDEL